MDTIYSQLATEILNSSSQKPGQQSLVGIAGPPGCGKTTIAENVVRLLNRTETASNHGDKLPTTAIAVSMDGFHLTRQQLDNFSNPTEAHVRRGAPWTFDAEGVLKFVGKLRNSSTLTLAERKPVYAPSFDHAVKDPVENDTVIPPESTIIILEGNYLLLDEEIWRDISPLLDLRIFVDVDPVLARNRVAIRHVKSGIEPTIEDGQRRFDSNDGLNGDLIRTRLVNCDIKVTSIELQRST